MRRLPWLIAALALGLPAVFAQQTPDMVWTTVTVINKDGRLATDLTKADFTIEDNGTPREVDAFRSDLIPFAAVIMVDISSSMQDQWPSVRRGVEQLIARFEPGDRVLLGGFDALPWVGARFSSDRKTLLRALTDVIGGSPNLCSGDWTDTARQTGASNAGSGRKSAGGSALSYRLVQHAGTAAWDGLACGINAAASDAETPRRVVLLITDGRDNASTTKIGQAITFANDAGVMVYTIGMIGSDGLADGDLRAIAEGTGGGFYLLKGKDDAFAAIADELRHQYVLGFKADSVSTAHRVTVTTNRPETIARSRRVYMTASPTAQPSAPPPDAAIQPAAPVQPTIEPAAATAALAPVMSLIESFTYGPWELGRAPRLTIAQLRGLLVDLRRDTPIWIRAVPDAERARRRLGAATFVLDTLYTQTDPYLWLDGQPASDLIEWAAGLVRAGAQSPAERTWYLAAMALFERSSAADVMERTIIRAEGRFPGDAQWLLERGIAAELRTWPQDRDKNGFNVEPLVASLVQGRYEQAAKQADVRSEALVRAGYFALRRGHPDTALARFDEAGESQDMHLRYWRHLFRGQALERLNRPADAIASYELALEDVPFAQSAVSALGAALVAAGRVADAAKLTGRAMTIDQPEDPWTMYVFPDWRWWPALIAELQRAVHQ